MILLIIRDLVYAVLKYRLSIKGSTIIHLWTLCISSAQIRVGNFIFIYFDVTCKLKDRGTPFNPASKKCRICLKEKHYILYKGEGATLNRRSEIFNSCTHRNKYLLSKWKT